MRHAYDFGEDWFSMRIPIFEKQLRHLAGKPCTLLEIGAYEGRCATWLADNIMSHPRSRLDTLDLHVGERLRDNIRKTGRAEQITVYQGLSREILRRLSLSSYDFIYVDGAH